MVRIVKEADVRRDELLDTALLLFLEYGIERVSVEQITTTVGVAKGTFYHYFASKSELVEQLVQRFSDGVFDAIEAALAEANGSALDRFQALITASTRAKLGQRTETLMLTKSLYAEENRSLRGRLRDGWMSRTRPLMLQIISQGQEEGVFDVPDVVAMTDIWLSLWYDYGMHVAEIFFAVQDDPSRQGELVSAMRALVVAQERVLGAKPGSLDMGIERTTVRYLQGEV
jgi:AcrR family transcriptional regulator